MKRLATALLLLISLQSFADDAYPTIVEIAFEGNEVTRPQVMLREMVVKVGDPADPAQIEKSRQGIQDLGLFRRVNLRQEPVDGGVRLVFRVDERYYFLPLPRGDVKSDGRYSYGAQLRWDNVTGRNHSLYVLVEQEDRKRQGIGKETNFVASYRAPFAFGSPYALSGSVGYTTRPVQGDLGEYTEDFRTVSLRGSRTYSDGAASQGYTVGTGVNWQQQRTSGEFAPAAYGDALAPVLQIRYRDFHNHIYSDVGRWWSVSVEGAHRELGSDYNYTAWNAAYASYFNVGSLEHQTVHLKAYTGLYFSGPDGVRQFGLGGSSALRSYDSNFIEGNAYYYLTAEYARPLYWRWLRGVVIAEAGNVFAHPEDANFQKVYSSIGVALRLRLTHFVDFEMEIGYSYSLDGSGARLFGGRV
ncbi:hypothetical protein E4T66_10360 [Sinimarinibacterium sp. CAU 1509]|uniref:POTRA domain-containing protein n=1 Tax=Sinimarinibacterium sp. CAU 1509 TaxID=2562283 RepID=UPI0010ACBB92|nr:POTRA domain-containing protein [Sinimarinibacterium sp. CAU 1509]TJY61030.1 hypothetical protein E4T66_10360 [Sinimarinibacterium sp. CAU 1509]